MPHIKQAAAASVRPIEQKLLLTAYRKSYYDEYISANMTPKVKS